MSPEATKWNPSVLQKFRHKTDPLADKLIEEIISSGEEMAINKLFNDLVKNAGLSDVQFPKNVEKYFQETSILPEWADQKKIRIGQKVFERHGPTISLVLMFKSLPEAYACANGAMVLYKTGRLSTHNGSVDMLTRRLMETAQFVINVCEKGGLNPDGNGIITAQKVRLIHAAIRYFLKKDDWDTATLGEPINQEDMAGTLQSFSTLILEGLKMIGIELTPKENEGYFHCWRIIGHVMGLDPELNVETYKEGHELGYAILDHQCAASEQGKELTKAMISFIEHMLPGNLFEHIPPALIRFFVGDRIAGFLALEEHHNLLEKIIPKLPKETQKDIAETDDPAAIFGKLVSHINMFLLNSMNHYFNHYKGVHFYIPPSLKENWKLQVMRESVMALTP
ncbi:MAG: DUF2236 domain-containing protein, partial [Bacteroidetes bacterium]|nr:DUF2236 domain-containing protein [Bacteroidota bacterium]